MQGLVDALKRNQFGCHKVHDDSGKLSQSSIVVVCCGEDDEEGMVKKRRFTFLRLTKCSGGIT